MDSASLLIGLSMILKLIHKKKYKFESTMIYYIYKVPQKMGVVVKAFLLWSYEGAELKKMPV